MDVFTVSLFGHRKIDDLRQLDEKLTPMIKELIKTKPYVAFLIGRNGEFDEYAASLIKRARKEVERENSDLTLVLPYSVTDLQYYEKYYDHVMIPECIEQIHPKGAITKRNQWMTEQADLFICYINHKEGGAYSTLKYAKKLQKEIINLAEKPFLNI